MSRFFKQLRVKASNSTLHFTRVGAKHQSGVANCWFKCVGVFLNKKLISLQIIYFVHVLLECNLFEINISYGFQNIKAINLLHQQLSQPSAQLTVTLSAGRDQFPLPPVLSQNAKKNSQKRDIEGVSWICGYKFTTKLSISRQHWSKSILYFQIQNHQGKCCRLWWECKELGRGRV